MHSVTVRHNMETGHRLPHLGGKCQNLHGHSWWAEMTVSSEQLTHLGTVAEYGALKKLLREWIDSRLDHGLMLGAADPLTNVMLQYGRVFIFGAVNSDPDVDASDLAYPTVENVAVLLSRVVDAKLTELPALQVADGAHCSRVIVSETHVNTATWSRT